MILMLGQEGFPSAIRCALREVLDSGGGVAIWWRHFGGYDPKH